jgi:putative ABC transport system ATP-binding protein
MGEIEVQALRGVSIKIKKGEILSIMGPSGSGKSTMMNTLGCLDRPTSGDYFLDGERVSDLADDQLAAIRNRKIGFIFQSYNLLPRTSALDQVIMPLLYQDVGKKERIERATIALGKVGLAEKLGNFPNEMSGGQQQRVSIARAIVTNPSIILADEPTGALDSKTGVEIMEILTELNREGKTIILITHEHEVDVYAKRHILLRDGNVIH